jgi:hypothetical protein
MKRVFCDICEQEIGKHNQIPEGGRLKAELSSPSGVDTLQVEVLTGLNGTLNAGDFCKYCVVDALSKIDDRPKKYLHG